MGEARLGIFDSGLGGLTVLKEIVRILPQEKIVYFGDTARLPYGTKSKKAVINFSRQIANFLQGLGAKLIVVACNTASSLALSALKKEFKIPILGVIEPLAEEAVRLTRNGRIGIIGTRASIHERAYERIIKKINKKIKTFSFSCPLFVPLVEEGWIEGEIPLQIAKQYLEPLKGKGIDTLILGCTHYPVLKNIISKVLGPSVRLIDSAHVTAVYVRGVLEEKNLLSKGKPPHQLEMLTQERPTSWCGGKGSIQFYVTDEPQNFSKMGKIFLGSSIKPVKLVTLDV